MESTFYHRVLTTPTFLYYQDAAVEALRGKLDGVTAALRDRQHEADEQVIRQFYGLTTAQSRQLDGSNAASEPQEADNESLEQV